MVTRETLLKLLACAKAETLRFADTASPEEMERSGTPQHWAPRDVLAHLAYWHAVMAERIGLLRAGFVPRQVDDLNATNESVFERYHLTPWADILLLLEEAHTELLHQISLLSEEEINNPERLSISPGQPLWRSIISTEYVHPVSHLFIAYLERGDRTSAFRLAQDEFRQLQPLDRSDSWQATLMYNQACHWALAGDSGRALSLLEQSILLAPALAEWAGQDDDLASLRENITFQALIRRTPPPG